MRTSSAVISFLSLCGTSLAAPAPHPVASPAPTAAPSLEERQLVGSLLGLVDNILGNAVSELDSVFDDVAAGRLGGTAAWSSVKSALQPVTATTTQTDAAEAISTLAAIHSARPSANLYQFVASLVAEGLTVDSVADALAFVDGGLTGENSMNNL